MKCFSVHLFTLLCCNFSFGKFDSSMKRGAARGRSRSSTPPSCSNVAQPVSDFDTATAEIVAAVKLLPRQKPPASPSFQPVRTACALIRAGRTAASKETAVRPSVGG